MNNNDALNERLSEALNQLTLPLRANKGLDHDAFNEASQVIDDCAESWRMSTAVPRDALAELVDVFGSLDSVAYSYPEPDLSAIRSAAQQLQHKAEQAVSEDAATTNTTSDAAALAAHWENFVSPLRDGHGADARSLESLEADVRDLAGTWKQEANIPKSIAKVLVEIFASTVLAADEYQGEQRDEVMNVAYSLQDTVWQFVNADSL